MSRSDLLAVTLVVVLWGFNFVPTLYALNNFTPFQLGAARFLLVALPMIFFVRRPPIPGGWLALYGLTQGVGQFGLLFFALELGMTAALASVLMQTQIFFTALLGTSLLGEKISRALKMGMVVAAAGLMCFAVNVAAAGATDGVTPLSFLLTLCAASMWAGSNVVVKKMQASGLESRPLALIVWSSLVSAGVFVLMSWGLDDAGAHGTWAQAGALSWLSLLYLGWVAGGVAFLLWTVLLTRHPASRVAPFSLGIPVVGMLAGIFILGEQVATLQWVGSALVMSALVIVVAGSLYSLRRMRRRYERELQP